MHSLSCLSSLVSLVSPSLSSVCPLSSVFKSLSASPSLLVMQLLRYQYIHCVSCRCASHHPQECRLPRRRLHRGHEAAHQGARRSRGPRPSARQGEGHRALVRPLQDPGARRAVPQRALRRSPLECALRMQVARANHLAEPTELASERPAGGRTEGERWAGSGSASG